MINKQNPQNFFPCPCCEYATLDAPPPGTFDICPICRWEDDNVQFDDPDYRGGANDESLNEARANWKIREEELRSKEKGKTTVQDLIEERRRKNGSTNPNKP